MKRTRHVFFATCAPGLEGVLHDEVRALRLARHERQVGGVRFEGTFEDAWRANLELRTAVRVLLRLARFSARDADALYAGVSAVDWSAWIAPEASLRVDGHVKDSALTHSRFVAQRTKDAVVDQLRARTGTRPDVDLADPTLRLQVHVWRDQATLSLDTSGESLHRRGWRVAQGRAPLSETLAAGVVALSGWDRRAPLLDPFAGSGTILIEAGLGACRVPPGWFRRGFAFERLPGHDPGAFARYREHLGEQRLVPRKLRLIGLDHDPHRVEEARANAAAAGLGESITIELGDARELVGRAGWNAWIVSNLPFGERIGDARELPRLYRAFGERVRACCAGYRLALLTEAGLAEALELPHLRRHELLHGGLACTLLTGSVPAPASSRDPAPPR